MSFVPKVRKIKDKEELAKVLQAAKEDNDGCSLPTHVVEKNDEIVGCASIALVPVLMMWHHTKKIGPKESMQLKNTYESILEEKGVNQYIILCNKNSPYNQHMEKFGYESVWETEVFTKNIYL
jgi:hypothetical protein